MSTTVWECGCYVNPLLIFFSAAMSTKPLSPRELRVWHAFLLMGEDVLGSGRAGHLAGYRTVRP
jgi:hypothetical protein